jgi:hypothetical protein
MEITKEYKLDLLTENSVSLVMIDYLTMKDGSKVQVGPIARRAYTNSALQRQELMERLPEKYYNAIFAVWGDTPTIVDLEPSKISE